MDTVIIINIFMSG